MSINSIDTGLNSLLEELRQSSATSIDDTSRTPAFLEEINSSTVEQTSDVKPAESATLPQQKLALAFQEFQAARDEMFPIVEKCRVCVGSDLKTNLMPERRAMIDEFVQTSKRYDAAKEAYEAAQREIVQTIDFAHPENSIEAIKTLNHYSL